MRPIERAGSPPGDATPPRWGTVLRALREARGATLDGWGARLGVSRRTVQRWEAGARAPDPGAETALLAYCREAGLFRSHDRGPLAGLALTAEFLQEMLAEARWRVGGGSARAAPPTEPVASEQAHVTPHQDPPPAPSNLPAPLTSFIGREREIAAVRRLQAGTRLLTLTGAGGVGKTRLALELARELLWAYPHGVWLVELAALADPALVPQAVAASLGLQPTGSRAPAEDVREFLRGRHLLLILDNCEHLLSDCARLTEMLLRAVPTLEVMATSREPLSIGGETVWHVPPLAVPGSELPAPGSEGTRGARDSEPRTADAVRLFVERARLHRPDFELTARNAEAVAELCRQLDGIPLAIELAAARVRVLAPEQIAARLEDRFQLLTGGVRTSLPRHRTLRAALDWSYDLLSEDEQALLRQLTVFAGGFTLEAAEAVCRPSSDPSPATAKEAGTDGPAAAESRPPRSQAGSRWWEGVTTLDLLTSLVDKSLVIAEDRDGGIRHRLLETIRQYAAERLDAAADAAVVRDRHLTWFLMLAETADRMMRGPHEAEWLTGLEREHDNLRAALRWSLHRGPEPAMRLATDLARLWESRGHLAEGQAWLTQALAVEGDAPAALRARALRGAGALAEMRGEFTAAHALHERALHLYRQAQDSLGVAEALASLGWALYRQGDYDAARAALEASLVLHRQLQHKPGIAGAQGTLGLIAQRQGEHDMAAALIEERLAINRELGDRYGIADALEDLATVAGERGDGERQVALLEESLALFRRLGDTHGVALTLGSLGMAQWAWGERHHAPATLRESLALYRRLNDPRGIAKLLAYQSMVALYDRAYVRAEALCRKGLAQYRALGDAWAIGRYLPVLAMATFGQGRSERAARLLGAAAALRARLGTPLPPVYRSDHDRAISAVRRALGDQPFAAAWHAGEALTLDEATAEALADTTPA